MKNKYPSKEFLNECFLFDKGELYWKERPREHFNTISGYKQFNKRFPGKRAGGYYRTTNLIGVGDWRLWDVKIIWLMFKEGLPPKFIGFKDFNPNNKHPDNLIPANFNERTLIGKPVKNATGHSNVFLRDDNSGYLAIVVNAGKKHTKTTKSLEVALEFVNKKKFELGRRV